MAERVSLDYSSRTRIVGVHFGCSARALPGFAQIGAPVDGTNSCPSPLMERRVELGAYMFERVSEMAPAQRDIGPAMGGLRPTRRTRSVDMFRRPFFRNTLGFWLLGRRLSSVAGRRLVVHRPSSVVGGRRRSSSVVVDPWTSAGGRSSVVFGRGASVCRRSSTVGRRCLVVVLRPGSCF